MPTTKSSYPFLSASAFLGGVPPPNPPHEMPFWRYLPASPPLPHPKWAQSEAPAALGGRLKPPLSPRAAGAPACTHVPCALPPRGRAPYRLGAYNKCPAAYSPATAPALLGMPKAGAMAGGAAIAPASPPPTPKGVDFYRAAYNKCPAVCSPLQAPDLLGNTKAGAMADGAAIAPASPPPTPKGADFLSYINEILKVVGGGGYNWVYTIFSIYGAPNPGLSALEPPHHKLRGEV